MKKFGTALLAFVVLLSLSGPAWAREKSSDKKPTLIRNDTHWGHYRSRYDRHKLKVLKQFRELKKTYSKANEDAQKMFLEFLGSALPSSDVDIQQIRDAYEQQIAQLNETIAANQQQYDAMEASYQQQLTDMQASCQLQLADLSNSCEQQISALQQAHDAALQEMADSCTMKIDAAFKDGQQDGLASCDNTTPAGEPQAAGSWSTDPLTPAAVDVDGAGNIYVLDQYTGTVGIFDPAGTLSSQWSASSLSIPIDLAVDSQNNVYVLDPYAGEPLQKFASDGQPLAFGQAPSPIFFPMGLFVDSQDNVYVADLGGDFDHRVLVFDPSGNLINTIGGGDILQGEEYRDVAVDEQNGNIYVVTGYLVAKFDSSGNLSGTWPGDFRSPNSIAVGGQGQVFVTDTYNNEIDQYDADGGLMYSVDAGGEIYRPLRIATDGTGKLYFADDRNMMIRMYQ